MEQIHPLVRAFQNPRIVPGQTTQIRALYTEVPRRLDEVAKIPRQHNRRSLVANMGESRRTLRKMRHQRGFTLGRAMGSGGISSACTSRKRRLLRLTMYSARRSAASKRARRSIVPHKCGFSRRDSVLSNMARNFGILYSAHLLELIIRTRYRAPRRWQQRQHSTHPSNSFSVRARRPQCGQRKKLHELPFLNLTNCRPTSTSTSLMLMQVRVIVAVTTPSARSRETLILGKSS
jgi:hypothetical protein